MFLFRILLVFSCLGTIIPIGSTHLALGPISSITLALIALSRRAVFDLEKILLFTIFFFLFFVWSFFDLYFIKSLTIFMSSLFVVDLFKQELNDVRGLLVKVYLVNALLICGEGLLDMPLFYKDQELGYLSGRFKGFSMIGGSALSFINFLVYRELSSNVSRYLKFLAFLVFFIANFYVGRFGLLVMVAYELYRFIGGNQFISTLTLPLIFMLAKRIIGSLVRYNFRGLEVFESILLNGNLSTTSTLAWLNQVTIYLDQVELRFIGSGNFGNRLGEVNVGVDSAFLLLYNGGGIMITCLSLLFIFRSKYVRNIRVYYFLFCLKELFLGSPILVLFGYKDRRG